MKSPNDQLFRFSYIGSNENFTQSKCQKSVDRADAATDGLPRSVGLDWMSGTQFNGNVNRARRAAECRAILYTLGGYVSLPHKAVSVSD